MSTADCSAESTSIPVRLLEDVFSTGKTPELTYTPRTADAATGQTYDEKLVAKKRRNSGGVMLYGVSKLGKTSLVERVLPETTSCWVQGTRVASIDDFWRTIAQKLNLSDSYASQMSDGNEQTDSVKIEGGFRPVGMAGMDSIDKTSAANSQTWTFKGVTAELVEEALTSNPIPIIVDDFHHIDSDVRTAISKAIKPLLRKTFVVLIAIPSHSFDPAKAAADIGGRMVKFKIPEWGDEELRTIAQLGFQELNLSDPGDRLATALAHTSFGSPHVMQELCYTVLSEGFGIRETGPHRTVSVSDNLSALVRDSATEAEPLAFQAILAGKNTKGEARKPIKLKDGRTTDSYGIVAMALRNQLPPLVIKFRDIRAGVSALAVESIAKERIVVALKGMSAVADANKGGSDPIFSYREEVAYVEDPLLAFHLKYGDWIDNALL